MDPADQDAVHRTLEAQGRLLGQHDQLLTDIWASLQSLLSSGRAEQVPSPPAPEALEVVTQRVAAAPWEPHVPIPERYSGEAGVCASFLLQCSLVFDLQPLAYPGDRAKIAFVVNLLSGRAAQWATAVLENQTPASSSIPEFTEFTELKRVFDHPVQSGEAASQILSLRQGSSSVVDYSIRFRILAARSGWNDAALRGVLTQGLAEALKDELAAQEESGDLETLISLAIWLDNHLRERHRQSNRGWPKRSSESASGRSGAPVESSTLAPSPPQEDVDGEPMQLGRSRLSHAERRYRRSANLCLNCGQAGHFVADCPTQPGELGSSTRVGVLASASCSVLPRLTLPCTLRWGRESISAPFLVDSGADDSFISQDLAVQARVPIETLPEPRPVIGLNGEVLAMVTHQTQPLTLIVSGNHREQIRLLVIPASSSPGVLGSPWLARHNPQIDWSTRRVSWSVACRANCLCSALTATPGGSDSARRAKRVGRYPPAVRPGGAIQASTVGGPLCRGSRAAAVFLGSTSWQVEKTVPVAQQSVLDQGGIPSNRLFVPEGKVAVPSVPADVRRWRKERTRGCAVLLRASQRSQRQANRHRTPALSHQPDQRVRDRGAAYRVRRILDVRRRGQEFQFLVEWEGYGPTRRSWAPCLFILDSDLSRDFYRPHPERPGGVVEPCSGHLLAHLQDISDQLPI
ncbi:Retrotransposon-derived protein PEG10 [Takifugu flavidus]|uniref:Retrotransposon-derived protein PEG10 n=1 Tax=Takifugu flavidus TaxID=433684 RepID=A0A5C6MSQ4_9TELE|nr:Retrotransposon-derived protein PEG10 [Takifugu flavidus]